MKNILDAPRLTFVQAAQKLDVHVSTVWRWASRRKLPTIRVGGRRWVLIEDLEAFLAAGKSSVSCSADPTSTLLERADAADEQLRQRGV